MRKIILLIGLLTGILAIQAVFAQEGVITYENRINMHRNIPEDREQMKAMIPEFRTAQLQLFFNETESLYKSIEEDEEQFSGSGNIRMSFRMPKTELYTNRTEGTTASFQELGGKKYIIQDTVKMSPWKLGTETKEILGYTCHMAYYTQEQEVTTIKATPAGTPESVKQKVTQEITAWYTLQLPASLGPDRYTTLPGAVLAVDVNSGERVVVARKIELRPLKKGELKEPQSGTKISSSAFQKLSEEHLERMRANGRTFMRN